MSGAEVFADLFAQSSSAPPSPLRPLSSSSPAAPRGRSGSILDLDDLIAGVGVWKNISPVVRASFRALATALVALQGESTAQHQQNTELRAELARVQEELDAKSDASALSTATSKVETLQNELSSLRREVELKADDTYVTECLFTKANKSDLPDGLRATMPVGSVEEVQRRLMRAEITLERVEKLVRDESWIETKLEGKANKASVANALHRKANKEDVEARISALESRVDAEMVASENVQRKQQADGGDWRQRVEAEFRGQFEAFGRVSNDLQALRDHISALIARVTAIESKIETQRSYVDGRLDEIERTTAVAARASRNESAALAERVSMSAATKASLPDTTDPPQPPPKQSRPNLSVEQPAIEEMVPSVDTMRSLAAAAATKAARAVVQQSASTMSSAVSPGADLARRVGELEGRWRTLSSEVHTVEDRMVSLEKGQDSLEGSLLLGYRPGVHAADNRPDAGKRTLEHGQMELEEWDPAAVEDGEVGADGKSDHLIGGGARGLAYSTLNSEAQLRSTTMYDDEVSDGNNDDITSEEIIGEDEGTVRSKATGGSGAWDWLEHATAAMASRGTASGGLPAFDDDMEPRERPENDGGFFVQGVEDDHVPGKTDDEPAQSSEVDALFLHEHQRSSLGVGRRRGGGGGGDAPLQPPSVPVRLVQSTTKSASGRPKVSSAKTAARRKPTTSRTRSTGAAVSSRRSAARRPTATSAAATTARKTTRRSTTSKLTKLRREKEELRKTLRQGKKRP